MPTRTERLAEELHDVLAAHAKGGKWCGTKRTRIDLPAVRAAFAGIYGEVPGEDVNLVLSACLAHLGQLGRLTAFRKDNREKIPLPLGIHLEPIAERQPVTVPPAPLWHPDLCEVADVWATAKPKQRARYRAINSWLMSNPDLTHVPLRERALEIFAGFGSEADFPVPEKALDGYESGPFFSDRKWVDDVLRVERFVAPLLSDRPLREIGDGYYQRIGTGNLLLVVENSATYWSVVHARPPRHDLGHIAWGLGNSFTASVRSLAAQKEIAEVRYFGDLDVSGVDIPRRAAATAEEEGLPPVVPAVELYSDLLAVGRAWEGKEIAADEDHARQLVSWLAPRHQDAAVSLLCDGRRIAQEWVGFRHLTRTDKWHADLRRTDE
ncbi:hypothetical protein GCM10022247_05220 [Allokutzneria multivorans]|uniref:Wadjet protein JetD C-terminal domain-containing protein n=1 Tax=Allokutzneria multivorans TaxID=1142134 RepID=A0ABP7QZN1_9PSEU